MNTKKYSQAWMWTIALVLCLVFLITATRMNQSVSKDSEVLKIGVVLPITGKFANISEDIKNGLDLAVKHADGKIEYVFEDSAGEPQKGISGMLNVIENKGVQVVLSGTGSAINIAMSPVAEKNEIPYFAISATPELMNKDDFTYTAQPSVTREVLKMSDFLRKEHADKNKSAVIYDSTSDTLTTGSVQFSEAFTKGGGTVVLKEGFGKDIQYNSIATKVLSVNPDIVYVLGVDKVAGPIVKAIRILGYKGTIAGFSGIESNEFLNATKSNNNGTLATSVPFSCELNAVAKEYCKEYVARFNRVPQQYGAYAYDIVMMLAKSYDTCPTKEGRGLKNCIGTAPIQNTVTNSFGFNQNGDLNTDIPILIKIVKNSEFVIVE